MKFSTFNFVLSPSAFFSGKGCDYKSQLPAYIVCPYRPLPADKLHNPRRYEKKHQFQNDSSTS